jgi:hypothetical protein
VVTVSDFLAAGFLKEEFDRIAALCEYLETLLKAGPEERARVEDWLESSGTGGPVEEEVRRTVALIAERARYAREVLTRLPCEPLIYTGPESTAEMIDRLEGLLGRGRRGAGRSAGRAQRRSSPARRAATVTAESRLF